MVGAVFCIGVIGMYHGGIGGGGFMLVQGSNPSYTFVYYRETAPATALENMYVNETSLSLFGGLRSFSTRGVNAFYDGPIANAMTQALQAHNGTTTLEDLQNYTTVTRTPASITYRDYKLIACSAPSGGGVVSISMKTIECYSGVRDSSGLKLSTHRLDEATRFAYGEVCYEQLNTRPVQRANLGDPLFLPGLDEY
ncbi:MAG: hypothetical protein Q9197_003927 [Variospora fuerteventurae]